MAVLAERWVGRVSRRLRSPFQGRLCQVTIRKEKLMLEFISQHQFWSAVGAYWVFSAAIGSMPEPASNGRELSMGVSFLTYSRGQHRDCVRKQDPGAEGARPRMGHSSVAGGPCLCGALHDPSQIS